MGDASNETTITSVRQDALFDRDSAIYVAAEAAISTAGLVALDWDSDGWHVYDGESDRRLSRSALLETSFTGTVVCEACHLHPRRYGGSLAQVYSETELRRLPFRPLVFQQRETRKASRYAGTRTADDAQDKTRDAEAIWYYLHDHPRKLAALKRFELPGEERSRRLWPARDAYRAALLADINEARFEAGTTEWDALPFWHRIAAEIIRHRDEIPDDVWHGLGLAGVSGKRIEPLRAVIYTCWVLARDHDGNVRCGPDGRPLGWGFIRGAVGLSHSRVPNIARSQLTYHGLRVYMDRCAGKGVRGKQLSEEWRNARRTEFTRYVRNLVRIFQSDSGPTGVK